MITTTPRSRTSAIARGATGILFSVAFAAILAGCPRGAKETLAPSPPPVAIAPGESVLASVLPDGEWHPTGYFVRAGDRVGFEPVGAAKGIAPQALQVHIGRTMTQQVYRVSPQRVSRTGEIVFRIDPEQMGPFLEKTVDIRIRSYRKE